MLQRWVGCEKCLDSEEMVSLKDSLSRDKSPEVKSKYRTAWNELIAVVDQLKLFGAKENVRPAVNNFSCLNILLNYVFSPM